MSEVPVHSQRCEETLFTPIVADDERGARVGDGGALCEDVASADRHCVEVELPVALACDGEVVEVACAGDTGRYGEISGDMGR